MIDQQTSNTGRDSARQDADPMGVNAALAADGNGEHHGGDAADAAQVFADAARQQQSAHRGDNPRDVRAGGMHMMKTASSLGGGAVSATRDVLRGAIGATEDVATGLIGGASHVAADLVHGVRDVGYEVRDGATGLIEAVGVVGGSAVHAVAGLLINVVDGVRDVVGAAMGHNGDVPQHQAGSDQQQAGGGQSERESQDLMPPPGAAKDSSAGGASRM